MDAPYAPTGKRRPRQESARAIDCGKRMRLDFAPKSGPPATGRAFRVWPELLHPMGTTASRSRRARKRTKLGDDARREARMAFAAAPRPASASSSTSSSSSATTAHSSISSLSSLGSEQLTDVPVSIRFSPQPTPTVTSPLTPSPTSLASVLGGLTLPPAEYRAPSGSERRQAFASVLTFLARAVERTAQSGAVPDAPPSAVGMHHGARVVELDRWLRHFCRAFHLQPPMLVVAIVCTFPRGTDAPALH